jgi:hypothetical protein
VRTVTNPTNPDLSDVRRQEVESLVARFRLAADRLEAAGDEEWPRIWRGVADWIAGKAGLDPSASPGLRLVGKDE